MFRVRRLRVSSFSRVVRVTGHNNHHYLPACTPAITTTTLPSHATLPCCPSISHHTTAMMQPPPTANKPAHHHCPDSSTPTTVHPHPHPPTSPGAYSHILCPHRVLHGLCMGQARPHRTRNRKHRNCEGYGVTLYPSDMRCCYGFTV